MKTEFVSYNQAIQLRLLGIDEICFTHYWGEQFLNENIGGWMKNSNTQYIMAPLKQQVFRWFREKYGYCVSIRKRYFQNGAETEYNYFIYPPNSNEHLEHNLLDEYDTWEEAESACIDDLIKLVKGDGTIDFVCPDPNCPHCNYNE
jgi:hypothetical protein